nr:carbohydrate kinase [Lachnospiraceae bacterium]
MDIICAGEMLIDFTPGNEPDTYTANPGGAPANVAVSAARNGMETAFLGILGNDDFGRKLKGVLEENGIAMLCPDLTDEAVTTLAFVTLHQGGERSFTFARKPGADILLDRKDIKESDIEKCKIFHAGSVSLSEEPCRSAISHALMLAREKRKIVSFDVNYRDMIWHDEERCKKEVEKILPYVDFLKISDEELAFAGGEKNIPSFMETYGITVLVETLGADGAKYYFAGKSGKEEGRKVDAVDATGAGDAFWGGFLSRMLMLGVEKISDVTEEKVTEALRYGNVSGALCVQKKGGIPALPTREEIEEVLA